MTSAAPTMLTIQVDSAWLVVIAVSLATLPVVLILRRLIGGFGGLASGLLLSIPLLLPLVAAFLFQHSVLPEVSVLTPAGSALLRGSEDLFHLLLLDGGRVVIPYALTGSAGPWLLLFGASLSSFMLLRRLHGHMAVRRLVASSREVEPDSAISETARRLARAAGLRKTPQIFVSPGRGLGAFATSGRKPSVVLSEDLFEHLDDSELEAVLAHEIAHIAAHDVRLVAVAGVMRDMVAWNPIAHLAFRSMRHAREIEADRRAAVLTGNPLAVASGLVKMCKLVGCRAGKRRIAALTFLKRKEPISARVAGLLAVADGRARLREMGWAPYFLAAFMAVVLGLHVGAQLASADGSALAFVWGAEEAAGAEIGRGELDIWEPKKQSVVALGQSPNGKRAGDGSDEGSRVRSLMELMQGPIAVRERDVPIWIDTMVRLAKRQGLSGEVIRRQTSENWRARVLLGDSEGGFGTYWARLEPLT